jgi:hypothetical protein
MTMAPILDEGVLSLSFRLEGIRQVVPFEHIRELLGFQKGAPKKVDVSEGMLDGFWNLISGEAHQQEFYLEPHHPSVSLMDEQEDFGENEGNEGDRHGVELALLGFNCQAANRPSYLMINRRCCEATSGSGDIGSGCYLSMLAISSRPEIPRYPEHLLPRTSLGIEYLK